MNRKDLLRELLAAPGRRKAALIAAGILFVLLLLPSFFGTRTADSGRRTAAQTEAALEKRIVSLLSAMPGVGKVRVLVTLENEERSGGSLWTSSLTASGDPAPRVRGVGVVCEGASSAAVRQEIVRLLTSALGLGENRVWVSAG